MHCFKFAEFSLTPTVGDDGTPLFLASEVCQAIGLLHAHRAVARLDPDEKVKLAIHDGNQGTPYRWFVNEAGLHHLILRSRRPEAKKFKRFVLHEVLPSLRKEPVFKTVAAYCMRKNYSVERKHLAVIGRKLSQICEAEGIERQEVEDVRYDVVMAYPLALLERCDSLFQEYAS